MNAGHNRTANAGVGIAALLLAGLQVRVAVAQDARAAVGQANDKLVRYQTKDARAVLAPVIGKADADAAVAIALGRVLDQEKNYADAAARLQKAASLSPADPAPLVYLGETYLHTQRSSDANAAFSKAAQLAQAAVAKSPNNAAALFCLGVAQQRLKQFDAAVTTLGKARSAGFDSGLVLYQLGATKAFQGKWQEAVDLLTQALAANSGIAYAYYYRGLAQDKLGKKDQLVLDMNRFLSLAPQAPEAVQAHAVVNAAKR
jgi:tetratricopeptide (TPR) repeat protein